MGDELLTVTVVCRYRDRVVSTEYPAETARRITFEKLGQAAERSWLTAILKRKIGRLDELTGSLTQLLGRAVDIVVEPTVALHLQRAIGEDRVVAF